MPVLIHREIFKSSTVARRTAVAAGFCRTCVIDGVMDHAPAEYVHRPQYRTNHRHWDFRTYSARFRQPIRLRTRDDARTARVADPRDLQVRRRGHQRGTRPPRLDAILAASTQLAALTGHVRDFAEIMAQRRGRDLEQWMTAVDNDDQPALHSFVRGLRPIRHWRDVDTPCYRDVGRGFCRLSLVTSCGGIRTSERDAAAGWDTSG